MLPRPSHPLAASPYERMTGLFCRALFACAVCSLLSVARLQAGAGERLPQSTTITASSAINAPKAPKLKISKKPHLVAIGPTEVYVQPLAGPRVRRPPLLPVPKVVEPEPEATPAPASTTSSPADITQPVPAPEPSAFSPDAPPTLLPAPQKTEPKPTPAPATAPTESALTPVHDTEPELKDAVIYFETPVGPNGSRATIPALVPLTSPATAPQPESRAIYRKEKP